MRNTSQVIVMQPVLEIYPADDFALRPITESESFSYLPLSGELAPAEVSTAVMRIAHCGP